MAGRARISWVLAAVLATAVVPAGPAAARDDGGSGPPRTQSARVDHLGPAASVSAASVDVEQVSAPVEAPLPFSMVGLELPDGVTARFRTSPDGVAWSLWHTAAVMEADVGPDPAASETTTAAATGRRPTEPTWVGEARWLQLGVTGGSPADVGAVFVDSNGLSSDATVAATDGTGTPADADAGFTAAAAGRPPIVSRREWGADESKRSGRPSHAPAARYAVVHHTAGSNSYSRAEAPAVVRGIFHYHTSVLGWDDIAYNFLVDRYGRVYEGRAGGIDRAVVGAHAKGFNTGSIGVSILGEFTSSAPPDGALGAVAAVVAWKFGVHGIGTAGTVRVVSGGSDRHAAGAVVRLPPIVAHRDVGRTDCPGNAYYAQMGLLRRSVELRGAPTAPRPPSFADLAGSPHAGAIQQLASLGVTSGCGNGRYCPHRPVSRGEAVTLLARALGRSGAGGQRFRDVPVGHAHAPGIAAAVDGNWVSGYPDGTFRPASSLRREQMATVLARTAGLARVPGRHFSDVPWTSPHLANVNAIARAGITAGCGGTRFCPADRVTRGQMATLIVRLLDGR